MLRVCIGSCDLSNRYPPSWHSIHADWATNYMIALTVSACLSIFPSLESAMACRDLLGLQHLMVFNMQNLSSRIAQSKMPFAHEAIRAGIRWQADLDSQSTGVSILVLPTHLKSECLTT